MPIFVFFSFYLLVSIEDRLGSIVIFGATFNIEILVDFWTSHWRQMVVNHPFVIYYFLQFSILMFWEQALRFYKINSRSKNISIKIISALLLQSDLKVN